MHRQHQETLHHVTVLKEQLSAKDKQIAMLQADVSQQCVVVLFSSFFFFFGIVCV